MLYLSRKRLLYFPQKSPVSHFQETYIFAVNLSQRIFYLQPKSLVSPAKNRDISRAVCWYQNVLCCVVSDCAMLCHVMLCVHVWEMFYCSHDAVCCSMLQYVSVCCSALLCVVVCCSVLKCVAVCSCVVGDVVLFSSHVVSRRSVLHFVVFVSVLQCVAVCCSVLQCVAVCCSVLVSRIVEMRCCHVASWCVVQYAAVCCSVSVCCSVLVSRIDVLCCLHVMLCHSACSYAGAMAWKCYGVWS